MGTTVTCPILRYNPAVVAQTFASLSLLHPGRIFLGVGSGEALNEQAATGEWPEWEERWERLIEAVWESGYRGDSNIIDVYVGRLRDKVDRPFGCENLTTVRGVGYRIGADGREPDVA